MDSLAKKQRTDHSKKYAKSASPDLKAMHDQTNNSYHSSLYRHQAQTRQQNDRSARTPTTFNENASCDSPAPPFSPTPSPVSATASAPTSQQNATLSYHSHSAPDNDSADENYYTNTLVDYKSLYDAMKSSSSASSIDITTTHLHQHDTRDSLDTVLSYLCKHDELAQDVDTVDQLETTSFLRVMYLGIASSDERRHFLNKLSDGLSDEALFRHTPSTLSPHSLAPSINSPTYDNPISITAQTPSPPCQFHERKHHLLPFDIFLATNNETNNNGGSGISIVEADFTTDNNDNTIDPHTRHQQNHRHDPELILHYIYTQLEQHCPLTTLQAILNPSSHWDSQPFKGRVYSDDKSNGIDLCVYFYHDAQEMTQVSEDMEILWKIGALGIPILPIMSMSQQIPPLPLQTPYSATSTNTPPTLLSPTSPLLTRTTNTEAPAPSSSPKHYPLDDHGLKVEDDNDNDGNTSALYLEQRPIDIRRNELAYLFSLWRIKMMDISNLDIIGQPSFQSKGKSRWGSTRQDIMIENLLGQTWASSSLISPTPYHVLTLHQFMAIDRCAISKLLMAVKDQSNEQRHQNDLDCDKSGSAATATAPSAPTPALAPALAPANDSPPTPDAPLTSSPTSTSKTIITVQVSKEVLTSPSTISDSLACHLSKLQLLGHLHVPTMVYIWLLLFVLLVVGLCIPGGDLLSLVVQQRLLVSTWHASLTMVSHHPCGKSMAFIVNVYDGQDQPKWAPEPPLLATNMPLASTNLISSSSSCKGCCTITTFAYSTISKDADLDALAPMIVMPLPNKTKQQPFEGQYFYLVPLPSCSTLDPTVDYYVQVRPSVIFSSKRPGMVQGSPVSIPKMILCGDPSSSLADARRLWMDSTQANPNNIKEAWRHFRQHIRFYLLNSIKIIDLMVTEGYERDEGIF